MNTINHLIHQRVSESPDEQAFFIRQPSGPWISISWDSFQKQVDQLASILAAKGLRKGDRVAIVAHTCFKWELADKASLLCGAVVVGVESHAPVEHVSHILRHAEITCVFVDDQTIYENIPLDVRTQFKFAVAFEHHAATLQPSGLSFWDDALSGRHNASFLPPDISEDDPAVIVYTSGTTGVPKGIPYTHRQVVIACEAIRTVLSDFTPGGRLICWLPLANLFQRVVNLISAVTGQETYFWEDPKTIGDAIKEIQPSYFIGVPRFYEKVWQAIGANVEARSPLQKKVIELALAVGRRTSLALQRKTTPPFWLRILKAPADAFVLKRIREQAFGSQIRFCFTGSAPMAEDLLTCFHSIGVLILESYALSENIVPMTMNRANDFRFGSVGKPVAPNKIVISAEGAIRVKGPGVSNGYWKSEINNHSHDLQAFLETGDHGKFDDDGFLFLTGRDADMIKTSTGRRISLIWVESVYRRSRLVDHVVAFGQARPCLVVLLTINRQAISPSSTSDEIRKQIERELDHLNNFLATYERPRAYAILEKPLSIEHGELTPSLKVCRHIVERRNTLLIDQLYEQTADQK